MIGKRYLYCTHPGLLELTAHEGSEVDFLELLLTMQRVRSKLHGDAGLGGVGFVLSVAKFSAIKNILFLALS